ncbi:MAG: hypothetical protein ACTSO9_06470 [Candidatus Helarchaeota archaeon]
MKEISPYDNALKQLAIAAEKLNLDEGLHEYLKHCARIYIVSIPVIMDNGEIEVFIG